MHGQQNIKQFGKFCDITYRTMTLKNYNILDGDDSDGDVTC
jgi:hypothetical protein